MTHKSEKHHDSIKEKEFKESFELVDVNFKNKPPDGGHEISTQTVQFFFNTPFGMVPVWATFIQNNKGGNSFEIAANFEGWENTPKGVFEGPTSHQMPKGYIAANIEYFRIDIPLNKEEYRVPKEGE